MVDGWLHKTEISPHKLEEILPNKGPGLLEIGRNISFQIVGRHPRVKLIGQWMNLLSDRYVLPYLSAYLSSLVEFEKKDFLN